MKLAALMPVRNEDWVLNVTARRALEWADVLVILDHASTDSTGAILNNLVMEYGYRVFLIDELDPTWNEMEHRQQMLEAARSEGATHIASIDADEMLTPNLVPKIRQTITELDRGAILSLPWLAIRPGGYYIDDRVDEWAAFAWQDDPRFYWASAIRNGYEFHHRHPFVRGGQSYQHFVAPISASEGGLIHLQFLSSLNLLAKQALYQMQEVLRWPGKYLGVDDAQSQLKVARLYRHTADRLKAPLKPLPTAWGLSGYDFDHLTIASGDPWQLAECKRLIAEHGREKFAGLDLFGIV